MPAEQQPSDLQELIKLITEETQAPESESPAAAQEATQDASQRTPQGMPREAPRGAALGPYAFGFEYAGLPFRAEAVAGAQPLVRLTADLGRLPYSVEGPELRRGLLRLIAASQDLERGRLFLDQNSMIRLQAQTAPPGCSAGDPVSVIATAVALLLDFKPYLDLMAVLLSHHERRTPRRGAA
ncbi:MAG: hypothetical protein OEM59_02460 [Rhodospirillales bacterium]|nr:hypothetical protein [Rhodospirillales bacterium]